MKSIILIPAYQPDHHLLDLVERLLKIKPDQRLIIVNDGSTSLEAMPVFKVLSNIEHVDLLVHQTNKGKGEALKTGFNFYLEHYAADYVGVVTADADGQHLPKDIYMIAERLKQEPSVLWTGARGFKGKVPLRSLFGNALTKGIFNLFFKSQLNDTQTGLRGIPNQLMQHMVHEPYSGYDFELDMLAYCSKIGIKIKEIPIATIYIDNNISSHFNPIIDSLKIYFVFIRFSAVALISAGLDYSLFVLFYFLSHALFFSIIAARSISAVFNFTTGKLITFKSQNRLLPELLKYIVLALCLVIASCYLVSFISQFFGLSVYVAKIISETTLFVTSFIIQRVFIF